MAREYPTAPVAAVGGVVLDGDRVLLVRRALPPRQGEGSLPGGRLELGESLVEGAAREVREETGLVVEVGPVVEVFDRVHRDDAAEARWATRDEVAALGVNAFAAAVIARAFRIRDQVEGR